MFADLCVSPLPIFQGSALSDTSGLARTLTMWVAGASGHGQGWVRYLQIWRLHGARNLRTKHSRAAGGKGQTGETSVNNRLCKLR